MPGLGLLRGLGVQREGVGAVKQDLDATQSFFFWYLPATMAMIVLVPRDLISHSTSLGGSITALRRAHTLDGFASVSRRKVTSTLPKTAA